MLDYVYIMKKDDIQNITNLKFTDKYFKSFNVVYKREYFSDEDTEWFFLGYSIYKNVPIEKIKYYRKQLLNIKKWAYYAHQGRQLKHFGKPCPSQQSTHSEQQAASN